MMTASPRIDQAARQEIEPLLRAGDDEDVLRLAAESLGAAPPGSAAAPRSVRDATPSSRPSPSTSFIAR